MFCFSRQDWKRGLLAIVLTMVSAMSVMAQESLPERVAAELEAFNEKSKCRMGVCAVALGSGRELLVHNADDLFMPASNMKVLTSCFALARLGGDFKFTTVVYTFGNNVLVKGDFDPVLGDPVVAGDGFVTGFVDPTRRPAGQRFYRVLLTP